MLQSTKSFSKIFSISSVLLITLIYFNTSIANASSFYAGVDVVRTSVRVESSEFNHILPKIKLGYSILPKVLVELQFTGSGDDDSDNTNMKIKSINAVYVKLGSKPNEALRAFILVGAAEISLEAIGNSTLSDTYSGFSWALVLESPVWSNSNHVSIEYTALYDTDDVRVSTFSIGFNHTF